MPGPGPARILKDEGVTNDQETRAIPNCILRCWIQQDLHKNMWDANTPGTSRNRVVFTVFAAPRCKFVFMWIVEGFSGTFTWHTRSLPLDN